LASSIKATLDSALRAGIIRTDQLETLVSHFAQHGFSDSVAHTSADSGFWQRLAAPADGGSSNPVEDSEMPRFVRGFHDVLITLGVVAVLTGIGIFGGPFLALPLIILLAEILVKRQRLALPAFALTIAYMIVFGHFFGRHFFSGHSPLIGAGIYAASLLPFYLRYKIPMSLAALVAGVIVFVYVTLQFFLLNEAFDNGLFPSRMGSAEVHLGALQLILLVLLAGGLFVAAMWFDVKDRLRKTTNSDVAFWLHLIAAPALLQTAFALIGWSPWATVGNGSQAANYGLIVPVVIAAFMLLGIIIDRRAFVTSGLLSLGYGFYYFVKDVSWPSDNKFAVAIFLVGVVVLLLGIGWRHLRAVIVSRLPLAVQQLVPPVV
jgi:hypothetical protein